MTLDPCAHGTVAPGWELVRDVLQQHLEDGSDTGAAVAVYRDGSPVVDIWGGVADPATGRPWARDTVACVFSTTKGITAVAVHMLVARDLLDLDEPVSSYWPEFAAAGKATIPVRWLLSHQAGLPFVDADLSLDDLCAVEPVLRALEAQQPHWEAGAFRGYHAVTFGHLLGEVVHRVTGRTLGRFLADEVFAPLQASAYLGLPETAEVDLAPVGPGGASDYAAMLGEEMRDFTNRFQRAISLGSALPADLVTGEPGDFNDRRVLAVELGGSNLVSGARSLARVYAATVSEVVGIRLLPKDTARACATRSAGVPVFRLPEQFAHLVPDAGVGVGFDGGAKLSPSSFGHGGAGGSLAFADIDARVGFAYVPNLMATGEDLRAPRLVEAVRSCLDKETA
jgi:CubicO group peptidase (beta-lactamase class C family)